MSLVPLYGFVHGDTLGVLVLVRDDDSVAELARVLHKAAGVRVAPIDDAVVMVRGVSVDPRKTVSQVGLSALDRVDLVPAGSR